MGYWILLLAAVSTESFVSEVTPVPRERLERMQGTTLHPGCPVSPSDLRRVRVAHRGFDGRRRMGELIVHARIAEPVVRVFRVLYELGYPIERMTPASDFAGDDAASMRANNTSAFNCRPVTGARRGFSSHAYGRAIDLNPLYNPYVKGAVVRPEEGRTWTDRSLDHPARVDASVVSAFRAEGFDWGGTWRTLRDYQHFQRPLR